MRILVVLALTAALAWAGYRLFGGPVEAVGPTAEGAGIPSGEQVDGRTDADAATPPAAVTNNGVQPSPAVVTPPPVPENANPFEVVEAAPFEDPDLWVDLAAYVAHGRYADALAQARTADPALPADRFEVLNCLLEALAGDADLARDRAATLFARDALADRDVALLQAALGTGAPPAPGGHGDPLDLGVELATVYRSAQEAAARGQLKEAATALTRLFRSELDAPWDTRPTDLDHWTALLRDVHRRYRWDARSDWPSFELTVQSGEGLTMVRKRALAQRPDLNLSTGFIARANGVDSGSIHPGDPLRIPTEPVTVFVDVSKHWLLYSIGPDVVEAWPVGTGAHGSETITGTFLVGDKQENPTWWPKGRPPVLPHDPANPLGTRWIGWREESAERDTSYGFHGTREPDTIGFDASEGCVRMRNEDVEVLFEILPVGSRFTVRD